MARRLLLRFHVMGRRESSTLPKKFGQKTILTFPGRGNTMKYNVKLAEKFKSSQIWKIGYPDDRGWFNISSLKAENRYLTITKIGRINQLTMEKEGMYSLKCLHLYYIYQFLSKVIVYPKSSVYLCGISFGDFQLYFDSPSKLRPAQPI